MFGSAMSSLLINLDMRNNHDDQVFVSIRVFWLIKYSFDNWYGKN